MTWRHQFDGGPNGRQNPSDTDCEKVAEEQKKNMMENLSKSRLALLNYFDKSYGAEIRSK